MARDPSEFKVREGVQYLVKAEEVITDKQTIAESITLEDDDDLRFGTDDDFTAEYDSGNDNWRLFDSVNSVDLLKVLKNGGVEVTNGPLDFANSDNIQVGGDKTIEFSNDDIILHDAPNSQPVLRALSGGQVDIPNGDLNFPNSHNIRDNGTDAIQFDGSQNVTIANGKLTLNTANLKLSNDVDIISDVDSSSAGDAGTFTFQIKDASTAPTIQWDRDSSAGVALNVNDNTNTTDLLRVQDSGNVEIPNGDLSVDDIDSTTSTLTFGISGIDSQMSIGGDSAASELISESNHLSLTTERTNDTVRIEPNGTKQFEASDSAGQIDILTTLNFSSSNNIQDAGTDVIQFDGSQGITVPNGDISMSGNSILGLDEVRGNSTNNNHRIDLDATDLKIQVDDGAGTLINAIRAKNGGNVSFPTGAILRNVNNLTGDGSATTISQGDYLVPVDTSSNSETVNLPASPADGEEHVIKRNGTNSVTVDGNGNNIDGATTQTIGSDDGTLTVIFSSSLSEWQTA